VAARPNDLKIVYFRCGCLSSSYGWWTTGAAARRTSHLVLKQSGDLLNWRPRSKGSRTPIAELGEAAACVAGRDIGSLRMCFRGVHHGAVSDAAYSICRSSFLACRTSSRTRARSAIASPVWRPCLSAFLLPRGAPDPNAPPCMRQRFLPWTDGDLQGLPERVLAPQRRLENIGLVLRW
jgi:hypothetical protein